MSWGSCHSRCERLVFYLIKTINFLFFKTGGRLRVYLYVGLAMFGILG